MADRLLAISDPAPGVKSHREERTFTNVREITVAEAVIQGFITIAQARGLGPNATVLIGDDPGLP